MPCLPEVLRVVLRSFGRSGDDAIAGVEDGQAAALGSKGHGGICRLSMAEANLCLIEDGQPEINLGFLLLSF